MKSRGKHVLCVKNRGYRAALELGKVYEAVGEPSSEKLGLLRVIDESGEDYLFPVEFFEPITLPPTVARKLSRARRTSLRGGRARR